MRCSNCFSNLVLRASFISTRNCSTTVSYKGRPKRGLICQPLLSEEEVDNVKTILGLHVGSGYVSWTTVEIETNEISQMGITNFPQNFEKLNLCDLSSFASQSLKMLPKANYYITDEAVKAVSSSAGRSQLLFQSSRLQYVAMLAALINHEANGHVNRVLFLKHKLAARLFDLLIGTEVASSTKIVNDILSNKIPPRFSPLKCSDKLKSAYFSRSRIEKEVIGFSFTTAVTFLELMVRKNEKCLEFVGISSSPSKEKKSKKNVAAKINE